MAAYDLRRQKNSLSDPTEALEKMRVHPLQRGSGSGHSPAVWGEGTP